MDNVIEKFEKVSEEQFKKDWINLYGEENQTDELIHLIYNSIQLPKRSTDGSAGYDFILPFSMELPIGNVITIPTGIRCKLATDKVLLIVPRSGQGFKYKLTVVNTVGVIDSDYYNSKNEGHIMIKLFYDGRIDCVSKIITNEVLDFIDNTVKLPTVTKCSKLPEKLLFEANKGFAQGIITNYYTTSDDNEDEKKIRDGGFGSTDK